MTDAALALGVLAVTVEVVAVFLAFFLVRNLRRTFAPMMGRRGVQLDNGKKAARAAR